MVAAVARGIVRGVANGAFRPWWETPRDQAGPVTDLVRTAMCSETWRGDELRVGEIRALGSAVPSRGWRVTTDVSYARQAIWEDKTPVNQRRFCTVGVHPEREPACR